MKLRDLTLSEITQLKGMSHAERSLELIKRGIHPTGVSLGKDSCKNCKSYATTKHYGRKAATHRCGLFGCSLIDNCPSCSAFKRRTPDVGS